MEVTFEPSTCAPAQGNEAPRALFGDHAVVYKTGKYYDPSYGQVYDYLQDMENKIIDGYWVQDEKPAPFYGTIHFLALREKTATPGITIGVPISY